MNKFVTDNSFYSGLPLLHLFKLLGWKIFNLSKNEKVLKMLQGYTIWRFLDRQPLHFEPNHQKLAYLILIKP